MRIIPGILLDTPNTMINDVSRRNFLKTSCAVIGGIFTTKYPHRPVADEWDGPLGLGRVTANFINIYEQPDFNSTRISKLERDNLVWLFEEFTSSFGPNHNPIWYLTKNGYAHSGYIQRIDQKIINQPLVQIPESGILGEITVPYTSSFRFTRLDGWQPLYRLYYQSLHWVTGIDEGPDGRPWYRLTDHLLMTDYHAPSRNIRPIPMREYLPIAPEIPSDEKHIEISIEAQTLQAFEGNSIVRQFKVATGIRSHNQREGEIPTDTPTGSFRIQTKMPSRHMGNGNLTNDYRAYELPGVPWTMVFHETGVAIHGTYWHNNFGTRMSHGCVNMQTKDAKWLFQWTHPIYAPLDYYVRDRGTYIKII